MDYEKYGISQEMIDNIETAYEKLYCKSRTYDLPNKEKDFVLEKVLKDIVDKALENNLKKEADSGEIGKEFINELTQLSLKWNKEFSLKYDKQTKKSWWKIW